MNLTIHDTKRFTIQNINSWVHYLYLDSTTMVLSVIELKDEVYEMVFVCMQDNKDLYAEEAAAQRERERQRMLSIPGLIAPSELQDEMVDS